MTLGHDMNTIIAKRIGWITGTTAPIYTMLSALMPAGFGGVPWQGLVCLVFLTLFVTLLIKEQSILWNGLIAIIFWMPMIALHIHQPGTETIEQGTVHVGVIWIATIGAIHGAIQSLARLSLNRIMKRTQPAPAPYSSPAAGSESGEA